MRLPVRESPPAAVAGPEYTLSLNAQIRCCTRSDLGPLEWYGLFTHHREIIRRTFDAQERGKALMLVADVNGFPVGQVWIDLEKKQGEDTALLWAIRVFPPFRSLGLGQHLLRAAEETVGARGYTWAELGVERSNRRARQLYQRSGYAIAREEQGFYSYTPPGGGEPVRVRRDELILRKRIK